MGEIEMVDIKGFTFGLIFVGIILVSIIMAIIFSITKIKDSIKEKKLIRFIY